MKGWVVLAAGLPLLAAAASFSVAVCPAGGRPLAAAENGEMSTTDEDRLKGYDITETGLRPVYPRDRACSRLTSLYASWIDVDGTRRDEKHSGIDGGRLGDAVLAPAPGTVRRVWVADWGQGHGGIPAGSAS
jgi:hypothetical protein